MFRRIWSIVILLATAVGFTAASAAPASAGLMFNHCEPLTRH